MLASFSLFLFPTSPASPHLLSPTEHADAVVQHTHAPFLLPPPPSPLHDVPLCMRARVAHFCGARDSNPEGGGRCSIEQRRQWRSLQKSGLGEGGGEQEGRKGGEEDNGEECEKKRHGHTVSGIVPPTNAAMMVVVLL